VGKDHFEMLQRKENAKHNGNNKMINPSQNLSISGPTASESYKEGELDSIGSIKPDVVERVNHSSEFSVNKRNVDKVIMIDSEDEEVKEDNNKTISKGFSGLEESKKSNNNDDSSSLTIYTPSKFMGKVKEIACESLQSISSKPVKGNSKKFKKEFRKKRKRSF